MKLFERLKLSRTFSGLSQAELANILEVHPSVVTRYEGSREPGQWVLEKIASATGIPSSWIKYGTDFSGIVVGRIELPGRAYSVKTLRSIEGHLADILPVFLSENPPDKVIQLKATAKNATPSIFILDNPCYCLILFTNKTTPIVYSLLNNHINIEPEHVYDIPIEVYLNAYIQPEFGYLKIILRYAHREYDDYDWGKSLIDASVLPPPAPSRMYLFKFKPPHNIIDGQEEKWTSFITEYLLNVGCSNIEVQICKEESDPTFTRPQFAPEDWKFKKLGIID
ncbi:MAG: helix-turn-helix transcriptional regulator [Desulfobacteraceae bacterium]|nr:helix-turn-helix transcriptional regulator [Desulfobacteraceae bacterium]